jgi:hypothetical protein
MNNYEFIDIKYIYLFFLIFIFFIYGLTLSEIIDFIFPEYDKESDEYRIIIELLGEIGVAYLIYYFFKKYSENMITKIYNNISKKPPFYLNQLLLIAFSYGIFKHLEKSTHKITHIKEKYFNYNYLKKMINSS